MDATPKRSGEGPKSRPVRLTEDAVRWARIASGYTGESMADYVSRIVSERAKADADEMHSKLSAASEPPVPKRAGKGRA